MISLADARLGGLLQPLDPAWNRSSCCSPGNGASLGSPSSCVSIFGINRTHHCDAVAVSIFTEDKELQNLFPAVQELSESSGCYSPPEVQQPASLSLLPLQQTWSHLILV